MRKNLDDDLKKAVRFYEIPKDGCIRSTRVALNMSAAQLGILLNLTESGVIKNERAERLGEIQLGTLHRAAEAMQCRLVYAFAPTRDGLEKIYQKRRRFVAQLKAKAESEKKGKADGPTKGSVYRAAAKLKPSEVWDIITPTDELARLAENSEAIGAKILKDEAKQPKTAKENAEKKKSRECGGVCFVDDGNAEDGQTPSLEDIDELIDALAEKKHQEKLAATRAEPQTSKKDFPDSPLSGNESMESNRMDGEESKAPKT